MNTRMLSVLPVVFAWASVLLAQANPVPPAPTSIPQGPQIVSPASPSVQEGEGDAGISTSSLITHLRKDIREIQDVRKGIEESLRTANLAESIANLKRERELRDRLVKLIDKARLRQPVPSPPTNDTSVIAKPPTIVLQTKETDSFSHGKNLFFDQKYDEALDAFHRAKESGSDAADPLLIDYMIATCLRKQGKLTDAETIYREISSKKDWAVSAFAQWQVQNIQRIKELDGHLQELNQVQEQAESIRQNPETDPAAKDE